MRSWPIVLDGTTQAAVRRYLAERGIAAKSLITGQPEQQVTSLGLLQVDGRTLMVWRGKAPAAGRWALPGGRLEAGEDPYTALVREWREETGLSIHSAHLAVVAADSGGLGSWLTFVFAIDGADGEPCGSDEGEVAWRAGIGGDPAVAEWLRHDLLPFWPTAAGDVVVIRTARGVGGAVVARTVNTVSVVAGRRLHTV